MSTWTNLRTDYKDLLWEGLKKYIQHNNPDGTISLEDVTEYITTSADVEKTFFGAKDANAMNKAINDIMASGEIVDWVSITEECRQEILNSKEATRKAETAANIANQSAENANQAASLSDEPITVTDYGHCVITKKLNDRADSISVKLESRNLILHSVALSDISTVISGVTFTYSRRPGLSPFVANGIATEDINILFEPIPQIRRPDALTLSGCPQGGSPDTYYLALKDFVDEYSSTRVSKQIAFDYGNGVTAKDVVELSGAVLVIKAGTHLDNLTFAPMVERGTTASHYTPAMMLRNGDIFYSGANMLNEPPNTTIMLEESTPKYLGEVDYYGLQGKTVSLSAFIVNQGSQPMYVEILGANGELIAQGNKIYPGFDGVTTVTTTLPEAEGLDEEIVKPVIRGVGEALLEKPQFEISDHGTRPKKYRGDVIYDTGESYTVTIPTISSKMVIRTTTFMNVVVQYKVDSKFYIDEKIKELTTA